MGLPTMTPKYGVQSCRQRRVCVIVRGPPILDRGWEDGARTRNLSFAHIAPSALVPPKPLHFTVELESKHNMKELGFSFLGGRVCR